LKLRVVLAVMFLILDCAKTIKSEHETWFFTKHGATECMIQAPSPCHSLWREAIRKGMVLNGSLCVSYNSEKMILYCIKVMRKFIIILIFVMLNLYSKNVDVMVLVTVISRHPQFVTWTGFKRVWPLTSCAQCPAFWQMLAEL
jgi:hypothetical protein